MIKILKYVVSYFHFFRFSLSFFRSGILPLSSQFPIFYKSENLLIDYHERFSAASKSLVALDLGCGVMPQNHFNASKVYGVDLYEDLGKNITKCRLGYEKIPFSDDTFDFITAYDVLEHVPRYSDNAEINYSPFIFTMNEIHRVLKKGGIFLSSTPIYPFSAAFQDPTHTNIMTIDTFDMYFSDKKYEIAHHYGIDTSFIVFEKFLYGQHLVAVLKKH